MKFPLNLVQSDAQTLESQRECGDCTACCVLPRIPIGEEEHFPQGKRGYVPCEHLCIGEAKDGDSFIPGCRIYAHRPGLCRDYKCLWRGGIIQGDERRRPDRLGLMFTLDTLDAAGQVGVVEAWELWDGAAAEHPGRGVIDSVAQSVRLRIRFYGVPAALNYEGSQTLELGRRLSEAAHHNPQALAEWLELRITTKDLTPLNLESVMLDLDSLKRGEPVPRYYRRVT